MKYIDFRCTNNQSRSTNGLLYRGAFPSFKQAEVPSCQLGYQSVSASRRGATNCSKVTASKPMELDGKAVALEEARKAVMKELSAIAARKIFLTFS